MTRSGSVGSRFEDKGPDKFARRSPLKRRAAKKKRTRAARCPRRGCKRRPLALGLCVTHAKQRADDLWRAPARDEVAVCELAGVVEHECGGPLQAAHGFPRKYLGTRWLAINRFIICAGIHRYFTDRWPEWVAVLRARWGSDVYDELDRLRQSFVGPVDYAAVLASLGGTPDERV